MSHFTVTVIGENPDEQLAPYHEFSSTGNDNQYVKDIDATDEIRLDFEKSKEYDNFPTYLKEYYGIPPLSFGEEPDLKGVHKFGYFTLTKDGEVTSVIQRKNPNSKWDWYVLGGRWNDYYKVKNSNEYSDQLRKGDIDFEGMANEAAVQGEKDFDNFWSIVKDCEVPLPWSHFLKTIPNNAKARDAYHSQEAVKAISQAQSEQKLGYFETYEDYGNSKEAYIEKCKRNSVMSYAYIKDGQWNAQGDMGWFGISSNEVNEEEWSKQMYETLLALPDDTLISLYDCHI